MSDSPSAGPDGSDAGQAGAGGGAAEDSGVEATSSENEGGGSTVPPPPAQVDYFLHWTGDGYTAPHTMTLDEIRADFFDKYRRDRALDRVRVVQDPTGDPARGNVMAVFHPGDVGAHDGAIDWISYLPEGWDEIYVAFDVYFPPDYGWRNGFKMGWGVTANDLCSSASTLRKDDGTPIGDGINCATSKMVVYGESAYNFVPPEGSMGSYKYFYLKGRRADMLIDGPVPPYVKPDSPDDPVFKIPKGRWITVEKRVKMNDADADEAYDPAVDKNNGADEVWIDGVMKMQRAELTWRIVDTLKITNSRFSLYYGGSGEDWFCPQDQDLYFDNIRISKHPISH